MILKLIAMIILGLISAALSFYKKNYYVRVFDDILGREDEEKLDTDVGRGFWYGFFFPIYFLLLVCGLIALIVFLIIAAIIAAIAFVLVWVTEKILPQSWIGGVALGLFSKAGMSKAGQPVEPIAPSPSMSEPVPPPPPSAPPAPTPDAGSAQVSKPAEEDEPNPFPGGGINRSRRHSLD